MQDVIRRSPQSRTERVVLAVVVGITHICSMLMFSRIYYSFVGNLNSFVNDVTLGIAAHWVFAWVGALVLPPARFSVLLVEGSCTVSIVPLSNVDASIVLY